MRPRRRASDGASRTDPGHTTQWSRFVTDRRRAAASPEITVTLARSTSRPLELRPTGRVSGRRTDGAVRAAQVLAAEPRGGYEADAGSAEPEDHSDPLAKAVPGASATPGAPGARPASQAPTDPPETAAPESRDAPYAGALKALESSAEQLAGLSVDGLSDDEVDGLLTRVRRPLLQLEAVRARAAAVSQSRAVARAGNSPLGAVVRDHQRRLAEEQQLTPSEVKQQIAAGRAARDNRATGEAMADGRVAPRHAQRIADILAVTPEDRRDAVESELLDLAGRLDAVAFSRAAKELLARVRPEALARDEAREHRARSLRAANTDDGGFAFSGLLYGAAAEQARVALNAFRRPDARDEVRTPAQRGADAFEQLCAAALRVGDAPTDHGVRPQVMVVFTAEQYAELTDNPELATARLAGSGATVTGREVRHLVDDCDLFRVVLDAKGTPLDVSTRVRTVPLGLWRALIVRDGGCVWEGCDAPPSWCDVAHGNRSFAADGMLAPDNAMLLCRRHHRRFDQGPYRVDIDGDQVTITRIGSGSGGITPHGGEAGARGSGSGPPDDGPPGAGPPGGGTQPDDGPQPPADASDRPAGADPPPSSGQPSLLPEVDDDPDG